MARGQVAIETAKSVGKFIGSKWPWAAGGLTLTGLIGGAAAVDHAKRDGAESGPAGLIQYFTEGARSIGARTGWEVFKENIYAGLETIGIMVADLTKGKYGVGLANYAREAQGLERGSWAAGKGIMPNNNGDEGNIFTNNATALTVAGVGGASIYGAKKLFGGDGPGGNGSGGSSAQKSFDFDDTPKSGNLFSRARDALSGLTSKIPTGRISKVIAVTVVTGAAVGVAGQAQAGTSAEGDINTTAAEAASADPSLIENIGNGAHAFAHGFVDESLNTGTWLAGNLVDGFDNVAGGALSLIGLDTGFRERDVSADWQAATNNVATNLMGAADLSTGFARAMNTGGQVSSWFVGPAAVAFVKLGGAAARGTTHLATRFGAAVDGPGTSFAAGTSRVAGANLDMFAPVTP